MLIDGMAWLLDEDCLFGQGKKKKGETGLGASHLDFVRRLRLMDGRAEPGFTIARLGAWRIIII